MQYYQDAGQFYESGPQEGDQIFFWPSNRSDPNAVQHTGLVYAVDDKYVYTVEGNTSGDAGVIDNGGGVFRKKYKLSFERIAGYGRPKYTEDTTGGETTMSQPGYVTSENKKPVNFRTKPQAGASRVNGYESLPCGTQVEILASDGTWSTIRYGGVTGYMQSKYLTEDETPNTGNHETAMEIVDHIRNLLNELETMIS